MSSEILISIIIPVKNGDPWLENLLTKLMNQTLISQSEIIIIDSGSTDHSLEIIKKYPVKLIQIPSSEFNHGETRNIGARNANGKYVVMTVQDAAPASNTWLQSFLDCFVDEEVAGVAGQQAVPHDLDKNPVLWFRPFSKPQKKIWSFKTKEEFLKLSPVEQRNICGWDNVTSAYRRDLLLQYPFPKIDFAEDIYWAKEMILRGYSLAITNFAQVYHYHHQVPEFVLPRYFSVFYYEYKIFKLKPSVSQSFARKCISAARILLSESSVKWPQKIKWLIFNIKYQLALRKTIRRFNNSLGNGESFLDSQYQLICKKTPQAPKY